MMKYSIVSQKIEIVIYCFYKKIIDVCYKSPFLILVETWLKLKSEQVEVLEL